MLSYQKLPIILDGNIGDNIDSILVLCYLIKNKNLNLKLITTSSENTNFDRVKIVEKILNLTDKEVIVGQGLQESSENILFSDLVTNFESRGYLSSQRLIYNFVDQSPCPVICISLNSLENISAIINKNHNLVEKIHLITQFGNISDNYLMENLLENDLNLVLNNPRWASIKIIPNNLSLYNGKSFSEKLSYYHQENNIYYNILKTIAPKEEKSQYLSLYTLLVAISNDSNELQKNKILIDSYDNINLTEDGFPIYLGIKPINLEIFLDNIINYLIN